MESGTQAMFEQLTLPIFQELTAGLSEPLAKISALPGEEQDLTEKEVALYEKFLESWKSSKKKINPHGLSTKTLRECFLATEDLISYQSSLFNQWVIHSGPRIRLTATTDYYRDGAYMYYRINTYKDRGVSNRRNKDTAIAIPVLTPFREEKRQNGRRCKEAGEDMFTLTTQDQHGIAINADEEKDVWAVWSV